MESPCLALYRLCVHCCFWKLQSDPNDHTETSREHADQSEANLVSQDISRELYRKNTTIIINTSFAILTYFYGKFIEKICLKM